jgi:hypothetical protein
MPHGAPETRGAPPPSPGIHDAASPGIHDAAASYVRRARASQAGRSMSIAGRMTLVLWARG